MHIAAYKKIVEIPFGTGKTKNGLSEKSESFQSVVKIGRTHLMDATPLTWVKNFRVMFPNWTMASKPSETPSTICLNWPSEEPPLVPGSTLLKVMPKKLRLYRRVYRPSFVTAENKFEALAAHDAIVETHGHSNKLRFHSIKLPMTFGFWPPALAQESERSPSQPTNPEAPSCQERSTHPVRGHDHGLCPSDG